MVEVKICGITDAPGRDAAIEGGARWLGFVFVPASARVLTPDVAAPLVAGTAGRAIPVGLFADAGDAEIQAVLDQVPLAMLQAHGSETPARIAALRARFGLPVIKAIGIEQAEDLGNAVHGPQAFATAADALLLDAKPPKDGRGGPTGGHGRAFDWRVLAGWHSPLPWLLAGGLNVDNLAQAVAATGAAAVDISSGVERQRGRKDPAMIRAFLAHAAALGAPEV